MIRIRTTSMCLFSLLFAARAHAAGDAAAASESPAPAGERGVASTVDSARIVTLGAPITEIVAALGLGDRIVGVDSTSTYPSELLDRPRVGFYSKVSAEGVLSLAPSLVLADADAGPEVALEQIRAAGTPIVRVDAAVDVAGAQERIRAIASTLDRVAEGDALIAGMCADLAETRALVDSSDATPPRVLFLYARGAGTLHVAGTASTADTMIQLAGATNAVTGFEGFKPLTSECVVSAAPDVVLMLRSSVDSVGGADHVFELPGLAHTPAARSRALVAVDDHLLLGFGPRLGQGALALARALRRLPEPAASSSP